MNGDVYSVVIGLIKAFDIVRVSEAPLERLSELIKEETVIIEFVNEQVILDLICDAEPVLFKVHKGVLFVRPIVDGICT
jgi:hypothetical protein